MHLGIGELDDGLKAILNITGANALISLSTCKGQTCLDGIMRAHRRIGLVVMEAMNHLATMKSVTNLELVKIREVMTSLEGGSHNGR